jgi:hypothetical protein
MERGPAEKMQEMIKEMVQMTQENGRRQRERKENLRAPFTSPHWDVDRSTLMGHGWCIV